MIELYNKNVRYVVTELYSELFIKSCIDQPHALQMIIATNASLLAGLFHLLDDAFLSEFIRKLTIILKENLATDPNSQEAQDTEGQRPEFFRSKNIILLLCFLYDFDVLNEDFMQDIILYLADRLNDDTVSHILTIIQNSGFKIRQNSPGSIKVFMEHLRVKHDEKKQNEAGSEAQLSKKMDFMFMNINDLKYNKKVTNDAQDRLAFLLNWLKKSVVSKSGKAHRRFPPRFADVINNDFSHPRWWMPVHVLDHFKDEKHDFKTDILGSMQNEHIEQLEQMAVEQRFTSDLRKKIFIVIMSSDDYVDAAQKLMKMKLNKKQIQELAVVAVESCAQEEKFNLYYGYLAENLIKLLSGLKYSFQYAFWDHFKQLENYGLRKIVNLAKLLAFLVTRRDMGVQAIRAFEFEMLSEHQELFLKIFFKELFNGIDDSKIGDVFRAVNENENFAVFREGLKEYLQNNVLKTLKKATDQESKDLREKIKRACQSIKGF